MKKIFCVFLLLYAVYLRADLTPEQVQKLYATLPLEARDAYNQKVVLSPKQEVLINKFFRVSEKVKKLTSAKVNFTPKLSGWTELVFKKIYSSPEDPKIPPRIEFPFNKNTQMNVFLPTRHELKFTLTRSSIKILFFYFSVLLITPFLPIHKIKFRLFIQRE